jgi:hypothetical protein
MDDRPVALFSRRHHSPRKAPYTATRAALGRVVCVELSNCCAGITDDLNNLV